MDSSATKFIETNPEPATEIISTPNGPMASAKHVAPLMIPGRDLSLQLGLFNTVGALILFHLSFQTGFCALFLRNFI